MFLNSPYSLHGVTKRSKTTYYRKYINIIGNLIFNYLIIEIFRKKLILLFSLVIVCYLIKQLDYQDFVLGMMFEIFNIINICLKVV